MANVTYLISVVAIAWISTAQPETGKIKAADKTMNKVMLTLHARAKEPTIDEIIEELGLSEHEIDRDYGVQMIDPVAGDYIILVDEEAAKRVSSAYINVSGPYSNPKIETFGPPEQ